MHTVIWIASGLAAGVVARVVTRGRSRGFLADAVLGALGSIMGTWLLRLVHGHATPGGLVHVATAFVGAVVLVAVGRLALSAARGASQLVTDQTVAGTPSNLEAQIRQLSVMERTVLGRVLGRQPIPRDSTESFRQQFTVGERIADRVATFGGSWTFLGCFAALMLAWIFLNTESARPADPYPFILLNLVLSCLAAVQAPVIMMSQNRHSAKDRFDAQQDYEVNLRAELQITALHQKLDQARTSDWQAIAVLQQRQLEVLDRIERLLGERDRA